VRSLTTDGATPDRVRCWSGVDRRPSARAAPCPPTSGDPHAFPSLGQRPRSRQTTAIERRLETLERRVQTTIDETNRTFNSAHSSDQRTTTRIDALERRLQTTIDQTNRTFESAHTEDGRMATRLDAIERRLTALERARA
jgi:hypothetical protein